MKRAALLMGLMISLMWLVSACSGGSSDTTDPTAGPLNIELLWAEPATGASPLRVVFTANITGGVEPYYYAWDYTNDGSIDTYLNGDFRRTVSVDNNYYLRASDAGGVSIYNAVLTVTDSVGTSVLSDPVQVNVLGSTGIYLDPDGTGAWTEKTQWSESAQALIYVYETGVPVFFRAMPVGGTPPYAYHWDFDNDGIVDSNLPSPQHTYTYEEIGSKVFVWKLEIVDADGERAYDLGYVDVKGTAEDPNPLGDFDIIVNTTPPVEDGVIHIVFDPTGGNVNVPNEPELDMAVVVNPHGGGGMPPFEYYWDFENDGSLDSQALSPTIPYYDSARKILINPYFHEENIKNFMLRCMVIDGTGRMQTVLIPVEVARWSGLSPISVDLQYGIAAATLFTTTPPVPYAKVDGRSSVTTVKYVIDVTGGSNKYEFQFDGNGDGTPDPGIDFLNASSVPGMDGVPEEMVNNWYQTPTGHIEFIISYEGVNYFPGTLTLRSVDTVGNSTSTRELQVPVSLVKRTEITQTDADSGLIGFDVGTPEKRRDHAMVADWSINGTSLTQREFIIAGGRVGTSVKNTVERVLQTYTPATTEGGLEALASTEVAARSPINQERYSAVMWAANPEAGAGAAIRLHGGANERNGILVSNELSAGGAGAVPWSVLNEILIPEYYPLMKMAGTPVPGVGYVLAGGLHQPAEEDNVQASRRLLVYDTMFDSYGKLTEMGHGRYEASIAAVNGKIYVIGGREADGSSVATVEAFDPVTGHWDTFAPQLLEPRSGAACQVIGGRVYIVGGAYWPANETDPVLLDTAEVFNPQTGVWSPTVPLPTGAQEKKVMMNGPAFTSAPGPGATTAGGAAVNCMIVFGGEGFDDAAGITMGELNRMYEFTYFFDVPLPVE